MNVRLNKEQKIQVANSKQVYTIMQSILLRENSLSRKKEHFWTIGLNNNNVILYIELVALGSTNEAILNPMEVYRLAVLKNSIKVIICHNHPSGNLTPSAEDIHITNKLKEGGKLLGIKLLDHLVISEDSYYSMASNGLV
jgi:DNA repair protein RadC